jgi:tight adherence protein C
MEMIAAVLMTAAAACLAGGLAIIIYRQKALQELGGGGSTFGERLRGMGTFAWKEAVKANKVFTGNRRYERVTSKLKKLDLEDRFSRESFLLIEQMAALLFFLTALILSGDALLSLACGAAGFFVPGLVLSAGVRDKEAAVQRELPDALDIIAANIEGGLSLNTALSRYAAGNRNAFSGELLQALRAMQLGKNSEEAMHGMELKLGMPDVTSFVHAYLQAEKTGGNVKKIIKDQAGEVRKRRFQALKKLAHEAPVKLLIPLMIFIFPVIFIVLFGPIVIKMMQGF